MPTINYPLAVSKTNNFIDYTLLPERFSTDRFKNIFFFIFYPLTPQFSHALCLPLILSHQLRRDRKYLIYQL
ncbi:hypothetical protein V6Z12_A08G121700 [Gossypium hirsutum]